MQVLEEDLVNNYFLLREYLIDAVNGDGQCPVPALQHHKVRHSIMGQCQKQMMTGSFHLAQLHVQLSCSTLPSERWQGADQGKRICIFFSRWFI